jgi:LPXTG-motif cell wall-anchored protein
MRNLRIAIAAGTVAVSSLLLLPGGTASAHHPELSGTENRPCGVDQPWSGTFTARSDADRDKNWRNTYTVAGGAPVGPSAWVDDQQIFGPIAVGPFAAGVASVQISVTSQWDSPNGGGIASGTRSITLVRPDATTCDDDGPPCPSDPGIPADSDECNPCPYDEEIPADSNYCRPPTTTTTTTVPDTTTTTTTVDETTTTTTVDETTTTTVDETTTTTVDETTTTVDETTTTTDRVASNAPTTTAAVRSNAPTTTVAGVLPSTGSSSTTTAAALGLALVAGGLALAFTARRRQTI